MAKKGKKETLKKHLKAYSVAAVGVLAIAPAAEAAIQYSGIQNILVNSGTTPQYIDLNNDGVNDFGFNLGLHLGMSSNTSGGLGAAGVIYRYPGAGAPDPANLPSNYLIGSTLAGTLTPNTPFWGAASTSGTLSAPYPALGNFNGGQTGFLGVRFTVNAPGGGTCTNYGWIQIQTNGSYTQTTIIDWAYEDTCNTSITAGQRPTLAVPTMNQWGMVVFTLLLGGIAARMLRKREKEEN